MHVLDLCCGVDGRRRLPSASPVLTVPEQPFTGVTHVREVNPHDTKEVNGHLKVVFAELDRFVVMVVRDA